MNILRKNLIYHKLAEAIVFKTPGCFLDFVIFHHVALSVMYLIISWHLDFMCNMAAGVFLSFIHTLFSSYFRTVTINTLIPNTVCVKLGGKADLTNNNSMQYLEVWETCLSLLTYSRTQMNRSMYKGLGFNFHPLHCASHALFPQQPLQCKL